MIYTFLICSTNSFLFPSYTVVFGPDRCSPAFTRSTFRDDKQRANTASPETKWKILTMITCELHKK